MIAIKCSDVMTTHPITVDPDMTIKEAAKVLVSHRISGAPVVDRSGRLVGIISEGDLIRRAEIGTEVRRYWLREVLTSDQTRARDFVKAHATKVADIMTTGVVVASEDMLLDAAAALIQGRGVKRLPVVRDGKVVGIVSRSNIVQALASAAVDAGPTRSDREMREQIMDQLHVLPWGEPWLLNATVKDGVVDLWGPVRSDDEEKAIRVAVETIPGVKSVKANLYRLPAMIGA